MNRTLPLLLTLIFSCASSAHQPLHSVEFFVYSQSRFAKLTFQNWQKSPDTGLWQSRSIPVKSHYLQITGPYVYQGPKELSFFDAASGEKIAACQLNQEKQSRLLLFLDNPDYEILPDTLRYRIVPISLNPQRQVAGQLSFLNLSGFQIVAKVNDQILHVPANSPLSCRTTSPVRLQIALAGPRKAWQIAWEKRFQLAQNTAQAVILFPPVLPGSSQLDLRRIQFEAPAAPNAEQ